MGSPPAARLRRFLLIALLAIPSPLVTAGTVFRVATFNVENYLDAPSGTRPAKLAESKAKVRESIHALHADVLALEEMGETNVLMELHASLKAEGEDFPYWDHVRAHDTNVHLAILSKFPIVARRPRIHESFLLYGQRFQVSRGFAEVDIQVTPRYSFTLLAAHLKSRRPVAEGDETEMREQEALILRDRIETSLKANPQLNLVVLGDFNDTRDSQSIRTLIGRGKTGLIDTRPAERNGDSRSGSDPRYPARNVAWTYYYGKEETYSRIDYILVSPAMARRWNQSETFVLSLPNWGLASDHRPIVTGFCVEN